MHELVILLAMLLTLNKKSDSPRSFLRKFAEGIGWSHQNSTVENEQENKCTEFAIPDHIEETR